MILDEESERQRALSALCVAKVGEMEIMNHKTAWNALRKIKQPHKDNLKRMGYCESTFLTWIVNQVVSLRRRFQDI